MEWIDAEKSLPEKDVDVLVWVIYESGNWTFTDSSFGDDGWEMGSAKGFTVTHWMEITDPNA